MTVSFGRNICSTLEEGELREWLVTNGIGGYASGTITGNLTRRYHGLLVASLPPKYERTLLVTKVEETVYYDGRMFKLSSNRWADGAVDPHGYRFLESFRLDNTMPVWRYNIVDALIEKSVWMKHGSNMTFVRYTVLRASSPVELQLVPLVNYRMYHNVTHGGFWGMRVEPLEHGLVVHAFPTAAPIYLHCANADVRTMHDWYVGYHLPAELERGMEQRDDHLAVGMFRSTLQQGQSITLIASAEELGRINPADEMHRFHSRSNELLRRWEHAQQDAARRAPRWMEQLVLAADQFILDYHWARKRYTSINSGYPWYEDWTRDALMSIDGLTIQTGRYDVAREILKTYHGLLHKGLLPNYINTPDDEPEYTSADNGLWYIGAVAAYFDATRDIDFLTEVFPALDEIIQWFLRGTINNLHIDPNDGLPFVDSSSVPMTWMDAQINEHIVTPRTGKPICLAALWYNALVLMESLAITVGKSGEMYAAAATNAARGIKRFWNPEAECCYDVIDTPYGADGTIRPNQILAVSLPHSALTAAQQKCVVDTCAHALLTTYGLRTLSPNEQRYRGMCHGDESRRAEAYHQGTAWGWLLGPFALAHVRVYHKPKLAISFLEPMEHMLELYGVGSLGEVYDGDFPFQPRGCIASAWTVAETIRAWHIIDRFENSQEPKKIRVREA